MFLSIHDFWRRFLCAAALLAMCSAESIATEVQIFDLDEGDAKLTLKQFAKQAQIGILFNPPSISGVQTNEVVGKFTTRVALGRMLENTPLVFKEDLETGAFAVTRSEVSIADLTLPGSEAQSQVLAPQTQKEIEMNPKKNNWLRALTGMLTLGLAGAPYTGNGQEDDVPKIYDLSPFQVDESKDLGYMATNTLSGTRFNSSLRDVAASVSVWTQEFIDDTGLTDIDELLEYSTNSVIDTNNQGGPVEGFDRQVSAFFTTQRIRTRGIDSSRATNYFKSIIPDDSYKVGRYDDSRGPNGVLFGISQAGGLINQTTFQANTYQDSGRIRYSFGSFDRDRAEFRYNKVILEDKLAVLVAGLNQNNGHWRDWVRDKRERIYVAATWRPTEKVTLRVNYEDGFLHRTSLQRSPVVDGGLPWYDYSKVRPLEEITFSPYSSNGTGARRTAQTRALGLVTRDGNPRSQQRFTLIENANDVVNLVGNFVSEGYDRNEVVPADGSPGLDSNSRFYSH